LTDLHAKAKFSQKKDREEITMSGVVLEIIKTIGIESTVFGIGNIAQSISSANDMVSLAFLGVGALFGGVAIAVENKRSDGK
jgi:hypothetical protein